MREIRIKLQSVSGNPIQVKGAATLHFTLGGEHSDTEFIVVDNINRNIILGRDWLIKNGVRLYYDLKKLKFKTAYVDLDDDIHISSLLHINATTTLKPSSIHHVSAKLNSNTFKIEHQIYTINALQDRAIANEPELEIGDAIFTIHNINDISVPLINNSNKHITLKKGTILGSIENIKQQNIIQQSQHPCNLDQTENISDIIKCPIEFKNRIEKFVRKNIDMFAFTDEQLGRTQTITMNIDTGDHPPISQRPYRTPLKNREIVKNTIDNMLRADIIEPSTASWSSPIVLVEKKDKSIRFCVDYRQVNRITKNLNNFPLPQIDDLLCQISNCQFITTLDLKSGYWAIPMSEWVVFNLNVCRLVSPEVQWYLLGL